jgi:hypothetical protein
MIKIEDYHCDDKLEATKRERYWYEFLNADLNSMIPYRSEEEKKEYHKDYNLHLPLQGNQEKEFSYYKLVRLF